MRDQRGRVPVAPDELRGWTERQIDQIVEDQHLAVTVRARANADVGVSTSAVTMAATSRGMPSR